MDENRAKPARKAVLLGDTGVGKTTLFIRYTEEEFQPTHVPTLGGATKRLDFMLDGVPNSVYLWDTAGQEQYRSTTSIYVRNARAVMVVFDVTDQASFDDLQDWLREFNSEEIDFIIVGNKTDMIDRRVVSEDAARQYADSVGGVYFEASARTGLGVTEAFTELLTLAVKSRPEEINDAVDITNKERKAKCAC